MNAALQLPREETAEFCRRNHVRRLSVFGSEHPTVPWRRWTRLRNTVIHRYHGVDLPVVWETVQQEIPPLIEAIEGILSPPDQSAPDQGDTNA